MCYFCNNSNMNFANFQNTVRQLQNVTNLNHFITNAISLDYDRFSTGVEWSEPNIYNSVSTYIFRNSNPDQGLLLFTLCCWLDIQARYTRVWDKDLAAAYNWLMNRNNIPRGNYRNTSPHLMLTMNTINATGGSISQWFIQTVENIVRNNGPKKGNIYRFAGEVCNSLYALGKQGIINDLRIGNLTQSHFSGGHYKRVWMFIMFLRRDNSVIKCLLTRALNRVDSQRAPQIINWWYDPQYFDPNECELPVDRRVLYKWNQLSNVLGVHCTQPYQVAIQARQIAINNNISPSVFDAILFF